MRSMDLLDFPGNKEATPRPRIMRIFSAQCHNIFVRKRALFVNRTAPTKRIVGLADLSAKSDQIDVKRICSSILYELAHEVEGLIRGLRLDEA